MRTTALRMNTPELALAALEAVAEKFNTATENMTLATKNVLMLAVAPVIGLVFVLTLPAVSVLLTAYYGGKLFAARWARMAKYVRNVTLFFAAPFIGLAYIIALPFVGFGAAVYFALKAARK